MYLAQKCTGVSVVHNYVHHFSFSGIQIGFAVHSIADANLNNVSYNRVVNPKSVVTSGYLNLDSAGIYFDTHWLGYGERGGAGGGCGDGGDGVLRKGGWGWGWGWQAIN